MSNLRVPTLADVAAHAGVSRGTVSRVIAGSDRVSEKARVSVNQAIEALGYTGNKFARSLATGRSGSVAFLLSEPARRLHEDPTFSLLLHGISSEMLERELMLVVMIAEDERSRQHTVRFLNAGHVDAVIHVSPHEDDPLITDLASCGLPVVICGRSLAPEAGFWSVSADDFGGARMAVAHLQAQGCRTIGTITGRLDSSGGQDRLHGFIHQLGKGHRPELVAEADYTSQGALRAFEQLRAQVPDLDGIFVASDLMARAVANRMRETGLEPGDAIKLVGFDDMDPELNDSVGLSSIRQPMDQICREIVTTLQRALDGEPPFAITLPTRLTARRSSGVTT